MELLIAACSTVIPCNSSIISILKPHWCSQLSAFSTDRAPLFWIRWLCLCWQRCTGRVRCSHMVALVHHCLLSQYLPCGSGSTLSFKSDARILFLQLYETHRDWIAERYQNVLRQFIEHESQSGTSHSNVTILVIAIASFRLWHFLPMSIFKHDLQSTTCH